MTNKETNIEIEHRARFDEEKYNELKSFLDSQAKSLGVDDKDVYFFLFPDKLVKTVHNVSKGTAKIVLKLNKIGNGSDFEEIEIPIQPSDFEKATKLFIALETGDYMRSFQKRINYLYKEVEIALKWSEAWGYHAEFEILIHDVQEKLLAEQKIFEVAKELGISIMSDEELKEFTQKAEKEYKQKQKNGNN